MSIEIWMRFFNFYGCLISHKYIDWKMKDHEMMGICTCCNVVTQVEGPSLWVRTAKPHRGETVRVRVLPGCWGCLGWTWNANLMIIIIIIITIPKPPSHKIAPTILCHHHKVQLPNNSTTINLLTLLPTLTLTWYVNNHISLQTKTCLTPLTS